jgi:branched-chain amino acid transport system permease protein
VSAVDNTTVIAGLRRSRYGLADALLLAALVATFAFGQLYLALATAVLIMVIFALSLDLAQGYGGIETLGLVAQGIRENAVRMRLLGVPVTRRLWLLYALSAAMAGVAGALSAQVNRIVGLDTLGFVLSANVLVMLALGGAGRLYGAIVGAVVFMLASDRAAAIDPTNWLAALGVLLIVVVRFAPEGLAGLAARWARKRTEGRP